VWLYNHILRRRGGFIKYIRREVRRSYKNRIGEGEEEDGTEKIPLWAKLAAKFE